MLPVPIPAPCWDELTLGVSRVENQGCDSGRPDTGADLRRGGGQRAIECAAGNRLDGERIRQRAGGIRPAGGWVPPPPRPPPRPAASRRWPWPPRPSRAVVRVSPSATCPTSR